MSLPRLVDSHCHLGWKSLATELDAVLDRAAAAGLCDIVDVGIDLASSRAALARRSGRTGLHPTAGIHPNDCSRLDEEWGEIRRLAADPAVVAIGETGLDFYRDHTGPEVQHASLERHVALAVELGKPVILHCREAFDSLLSALARLPAGRRPAGVLHCFTGSCDDARRALDLGLHVSFAGPLTYPRNAELRRAAALVPEDRLLVETDAPFLPPQSRRGRRNEPSYLGETLDGLAELRGQDAGLLAETSAANAAHLFGFALASSEGGFGRSPTP